MDIAIYSGSFNPVHNGHLAVAEAALAQGYAEVWLVVSPQNPHKSKEELWPFEERMQMVEMVVRNSAHLKASDCETRLPRPSYTIHTLEFLRDCYPQHRFRLLIGEDNLAGFHQWKDYQRIIDSFGLVVYPRTTGSSKKYSDSANIQKIEAPFLDISSSEIRKRLSLQLSIHGLVPPEVEKFILEKKGFASH